MPLNKIIRYVDDKPVEFASYEDYYSFLYEEAYTYHLNNGCDAKEASEIAQLTVDVYKGVDELLKGGTVWMSK